MLTTPEKAKRLNGEKYMIAEKYAKKFSILNLTLTFRLLQKVFASKSVVNEIEERVKSIEDSSAGTNQKFVICTKEWYSSTESIEEDTIYLITDAEETDDVPES